MPGKPQSSRLAPPLVEPLSQRELAVLRLFNADLSGPEIAQELVIALSTVRTHTKSIYSKLNVNNRRAAVKRAAELGLIWPAPAGPRRTSYSPAGYARNDRHMLAGLLS
ncbi:MAG: hypothetical protein IPO81_27515 [Kouleothrix sp.]|nr:hypothetical protein [Kouleothrix sp.]